MGYFTIIHIIFLILLLLIFGGIGFLALRKTKTIKSIILTAGSLFMLYLLIAVMACFFIDEYTKKAVISNIKYTRILMNESMQISGVITNVGNFDIRSCTLNVRVINSPSKLEGLKPDLFVPKSSWETFLMKRRKFEISTVEESFVIGQGLKAGLARPFSVSVRYSPKFVSPSVSHFLSCH